jgi:hypothetical protein
MFMKALIKRYPLFSKRIVMAVFFVMLVFSCSKVTNDPNLANNYCGTINWSNTLGSSGSFSGTIVDDHYHLETVKFTEDGNGSTHVFHRANSTNVILNDQAGWTFTYEAGTLVKLIVGDPTGTVTYSFDTDSHLTKTEIQSTDETGTVQLIFTYTYDVNDDPVRIVGHAVSITSTGTSTGDYDITADYVTDKVNFLPLVQEVTPYSIYYAYTFYLSRHLINKWVIKITGTDEDKKPITPITFTQQYTYTYDVNGNVTTMVHTGNSNNKFTFTYSDCH